MIKLRERPTSCPPANVIWIIVLVLLAFAILLGGASWRIVIQGEMLVSESESRYIDRINLQGERGVIWDRNSRPLAMSSVVYSAHISPQQFRQWASAKDEDKVADIIKQIATAVDISPKRMQDILRRDSGFAYLRHNISPAHESRASELYLPYLRFEKRYRRYYPTAQEAAHVVGFISKGKGKAGIEGAQEKYLASEEGEQLVLRTTDGQVLEQFNATPAKDGGELFLTLDSRLQYFASIALARTLAHHQAQSGSLILMDVHTGDILALANMPTFNPNNIDDNVSKRRNRAIQDIFEPGSTMKPILSAVAIEEGVVTPGTVLKTAKPIRFGSYLVKDKKIDSDLTLAEVVMRSSNVGAVRISQRLTDQQMWEGYSRFGFGGPRLLGLPGETPGRLHDYNAWRPIEKATMAYGYGLNANLLQLSRAYAVLANNGALPTPGIVRDENRAQPSQVVSPRTATLVLEMMENVVSIKGTAPKAAISGYRVAGKTGTTHKRLKERKGYDSNLYQSVFVGIAPVSNPRFVCAVFIDEPTKNGYYGGTVAAPVFAEVMGHALRLYGVHPDSLQQEITVAGNGTGAKEAG